MFPGKPWTPKIYQECLLSSNKSRSRISCAITANRTSLLVRLDRNQNKFKICCKRCCKVRSNISLARRIVFPGFVWSFLYFIWATFFFAIILRVLMHQQFPLPAVLECLFLDHRRSLILSLSVTLKHVQLYQPKEDLQANCRVLELAF